MSHSIISATSLSLRILNAYHPQLFTLLEYIITLVSPSSFEERQKLRELLLAHDDPVPFRDFLTNSYVAESPENESPGHRRRTPFTTAPSLMNMPEVYQ